MKDAHWQALGTLEPTATKDAWRQLHWAAQSLAGFAAATLEARPDDSHLNLGWEPAFGALTTHRAPSGGGAGLRLGDLTLLLLERGEVTAEYGLDGRSLRDGLGWLASAAAASPHRELGLREWDMPEHPVRHGRPFEGDAEALAEVARWYANADLVLGALARDTEGASAVRCWPHHFDLATLVTFDPDSPPEQARSVGIGVTPADGSVDEPYAYAALWPRPETPDPGALEGGGEWHREGWFGAVLRASALVTAEATAQQRQLEDFLRSALSASRALLTG